jgi:hypothetical protein
VHVYVEGFRSVLSLLNLERVIGGNSSNNFTLLILKSLDEYGGMIVEQIVSKVVCFGSNGVLVFIGVHIGVATQLKSKVATFFTSVVVTLALGSRSR